MFKLVLTEGTQWMRDRGQDPLYAAFGEGSFSEKQAVAALHRAFPQISMDQTRSNFRSLITAGYVVAVD